MIIHSFERFGEICEFDPATGALTPAANYSAGPVPTHGHYGLLADTPVVLYRFGGSLLLRVDDITTPVDDAHLISYRQHEGRHVLEVTDNRSGGVVVSVEYTLPTPVVAPEDDPTPFAEAEDFDLGLFIANIAGDRERRDRIYRDLDRSG